MLIRTGSFLREPYSRALMDAYNLFSVHLNTCLQTAKTCEQIRNATVLNRESTRILNMIYTQLRAVNGYAATETIVTTIIYVVLDSNYSLPDLWRQSGMNARTLCKNLGIVL